MTLRSTELREERLEREQAETFRKIGGTTVGDVRRWLGVCHRCGLRPIGVQGMVCFECHQKTEGRNG